MNEGSLIKEIWQENRKLIAILSAVTVGLVVIFVTVVIIKNVASVSNEAQTAEVVEMSDEVEEAPESELELDLYLNDINNVIYHICRYKMDDCEIARGKLLNDGNWYVTTVKEPVVDQWSFPKDVYRVVLRKSAGVWEIVAGPSLVFSYEDFPNIPKEILKSANNL